MRLGKLVSVGEVIEREPATQHSAGPSLAAAESAPAAATAAQPDSGQLHAAPSAGH
jgi:hypothetical protein